MPKVIRNRKQTHSAAAALVGMVEVVCFAASQVPRDATEPPSELIVCPWGERKTRKGKVIVNEHTLAVFATEQANRRWDRVALDYQHNTVCPHEPGTPEHDKWLAQEPRDVAAFATVEVLRGVGLKYTDIRWTDSGKKSWKNFEDISPAVLRNAKGEVYALHSSALCRAGEMHDVSMFASLEPTRNYKGIYLKPDEKTMIDLLKKSLKKAGVKIPEGASDETVCALAADFADGDGEGETGGDVSEFTALLKKLDGKITALSADVTTIKNADSVAAEKRKREDLVAEATRQGKVIPLSAEMIDKLPIDVFSDMITKLGVTVPTGHKVGDAVKGDESVITFSAEERGVMKSLGITEEQYTAHKKKQAEIATAAKA